MDDFQNVTSSFMSKDISKVKSALRFDQQLYAKLPTDKQTNEIDRGSTGQCQS